MNNRKKQALQTRQKIIDSAISLFGERDFQTVTISEICRKAGVSTGNFYNYFNKKEDIIFLRFHDFDNYIKEEFVHKKFNNNLDAIRTLVRICACYNNKYGINISAQMLGIHLKYGDIHNFFSNPNRPFIKYFKELVENAIKTGELACSYNADTISNTILRMVRGNLLDWVVRRGSYSIEDTYLADLELLISAFSIPKDKVKSGTKK